MVFCGKPSRGCHSCRAKKTRCDQVPLPAGCGQCARAKRQCPGYRAPGEVMFKDESTNVIRKFKNKEARLNQAASRSFASASISGEGIDAGPEKSPRILQLQKQQQSNVGYSLIPTLEERAMGFFVTNYVLDSHGSHLEHFDYITVLAKTQNISKVLAVSMTAVGLAIYSHIAGAPSLMSNARCQYARAIQLTNEALRSTEDVKKDSTLTAIVILGNFETVAGSKVASLKNWAEHVNGAAAVIKLRGREQLYSYAGRRMLVQVVSSLLICCFQRGIALPDFMSKLMAETSKIIPTSGPTFTIQETMMTYASFRASILDGSNSDPEKILARALELDGILLELSTHVPPEWEYKTIFTSADSDIIYNGRYHVYHEYWIARLWNVMRVLRMLLNRNILDALLKIFSSNPLLFNQPAHAAQFQISTDTLYELQSDILATIPQHLGVVSWATSSSSTAEAPSSNKFFLSESFRTKLRYRAGDTLSMRMSGGYSLLWPLWYAGIVDIATEPTRQFVIKNLKSIGVHMGIQQALLLASSVESRTEIHA